MFDDDGFILKEIVSVSPFLRFIDSTLVFTVNGRDFPVSTTPILFSAHSVNQILSSITSKPKICATPQFDLDLSSQSAQLGFLVVPCILLVVHYQYQRLQVDWMFVH